jgi:hypothetical protein
MGFATLYKRLSTPDMFDRRKKNTNGSGNPIVQVEQVVEASMRPLPTETGDGTYITEEKTTGIIKDIPHLPIKDLEGLAVNVKSKLTGDDINDRDYIMEQVIQVRLELAPITCTFSQSNSLRRTCLQLPALERNSQTLSSRLYGLICSTLLLRELEIPQVSDSQIALHKIC